MQVANLCTLSIKIIKMKLKSSSPQTLKQDKRSFIRSFFFYYFFTGYWIYEKDLLQKHHVPDIWLLVRQHWMSTQKFTLRIQYRRRSDWDNVLTFLDAILFLSQLGLELSVEFLHDLYSLGAGLTVDTGVLLRGAWQVPLPSVLVGLVSGSPNVWTLS